MSTSTKIILVVVVAVVIIGGGIWVLVANQNGPQASNIVGYQNSPAATSTVATTTSMTATTTPSSTFPQGDSDQAIEQDMTSANAQMNGFASDSASMSQSMNDQPVQQAE